MVTDLPTSLVEMCTGHLKPQSYLRSLRDFKDRVSVQFGGHTSKSRGDCANSLFSRQARLLSLEVKIPLHSQGSMTFHETKISGVFEVQIEARMMSAVFCAHLVSERVRELTG